MVDQYIPTPVDMNRDIEQAMVWHCWMMFTLLIDNPLFLINAWTIAASESNGVTSPEWIC